MKTILLKGLSRENLGTSQSRKLRDEGLVPCVLYGGQEHVTFSVYSDDFKNLIYTPNTYLVKLDIEGKIHRAVVKEVQFHPVNDSLRHVDFIAVTEDKPIMVQIPTKVIGNSPGVRAGGRLALKLKKVRIKGFIKDLPDFLEVNIDSLELGKSIKVADISLPKIEILEAPNVAVASVETTRATKQAAAEA